MDEMSEARRRIMMTNEERLKNVLIGKLLTLNSHGLYQLISDRIIELEDGLCKVCCKHFQICDDTIESDELCIERFSEWCKMVEKEPYDQVMIKRAQMNFTESILVV